ncbi:MAG: hypothetical protein K0S38_1037 [Candidatus Paceibacter sp.]|jgi:hypothetical protein|nr:hypothetical protein [Candidatus Paceibacter sp.]
MSEQQPQNNIEQKKPGEHHNYEASIIETVDCGWDDMGYINKKKTGGYDAAEKFLNDWLQQQSVVSVEAWTKLSPEERKEVIFEWVENHQPADWIPTEPPPVHDFPGRDERIPATIISDLHYKTAEEIARELSRKNPDTPMEGEDIIPFLEVYTSANTPADTLYGADCFFKFKYFDGEEEKSIRLYIDITKDASRKMKKLEYRSDKADYILAFDRVDKTGEKRNINQDDILVKGREIARYLLRKIDSQQHSMVNKEAAT